MAQGHTGIESGPGVGPDGSALPGSAVSASGPAGHGNGTSRGASRRRMPGFERRSHTWFSTRAFSRSWPRENSNSDRGIPDPSEIRTPVRATTNRSKLKTSNPVDPLGIFQDHHSLATNIGNHFRAGATCQPSRQGRSRLSGSLQAIGAVPRRLEADGGDNRTRSPAAPPRFDRLNRIVTRYGLIPDRIKTTRCDQAKDGGSAPS